jgi:DUF4097 and DUF4098 domain-containing protein YvlB
MKNLTVLFATLLSGPALVAFQSKAALDCNNDSGNNNRAHFCEMREQTIPATGVISVDASQNGGISIKGWNHSDVLVRAQVRAYAPTDDQARDLGRQITVQTAGPQVRAYGPTHDGDRSWSVTYEIFVPSRYSTNLETVNGGVSVSDVVGNLEFKTVNGGLSLHRVGGYVHGRSTNGGVSIELGGDHWEGQGLDVTTTNGGVNLRVPHNYSAQFEAQTNNGRIRAADMPEVQVPTATDRRSNRISAPLGTGGPVIKVVTTNGSVSLSRI